MILEGCENTRGCCVFIHSGILLRDYIENGSMPLFHMKETILRVFHCALRDLRDLRD